MDPLIVIFIIIISIVIVFLGGAFFFIFLLRGIAIKNKKIYEEFAAKIIPSMTGGIVVFLATQLKGVSSLSIGGLILYSGVFFLIFLAFYISFNVILYVKKKKS